MAHKRLNLRRSTPEEEARRRRELARARVRAQDEEMDRLYADDINRRYERLSLSKKYPTAPSSGSSTNSQPSKEEKPREAVAKCTQEAPQANQGLNSNNKKASTQTDSAEPKPKSVSSSFDFKQTNKPNRPSVKQITSETTKSFNVEGLQNKLQQILKSISEFFSMLASKLRNLKQNVGSRKEQHDIQAEPEEHALNNQDSSYLQNENSFASEDEQALAFEEAQDEAKHFNLGNIASSIQSGVQKIASGIKGKGSKLSGKQLKIILAIVVALVAVFAIKHAVDAQPISVTINDVQTSLGGSKDTNELIEEGYAKGLAGDYVAVNGKILKTGAGYPLTVTVNGEQYNDYSTKFPEDAVITLTRGGNIEEEADREEKPIAIQAEERGSGPLHIISEPGAEGMNVTLTGKDSGYTAKRKESDMVPRIYDRRYVDTKGEKVVALTIDDGPDARFTKDVLDILKENDVKATFFVVGATIEAPGGAECLKREYDEGHMICSHTYDHASGSGGGVDLGKMTREEQRAEIEKGEAAIANVIGVQPNKVIRAPGGNYDIDTWRNLEDLVDADIGWNIDTEDWRQPGAAAIASRMESAKPGDIILCHDGGGDRSQTVEALRQAIPYLKKEGFKFVTIEELLQYPLAEPETSTAKAVVDKTDNPSAETGKQN